MNINNRLNTDQAKWFSKPVEGNNRIEIFSLHNIIFRAVPKQYEKFFLDLFSCRLPEKLAALQLIPPTKISHFIMGESTLLIEQEPVCWIIYPPEWTFSMLREAAKCILKINQICFDYGYETFDCHGFNILFNGSCPQFVDIGSFTKKSESIVWAAIDEFVHRYLYPLELWAQGRFYLAHQILSDSHWKRFYPEDVYYR